MMKKNPAAYDAPPPDANNPRAVEAWALTKSARALADARRDVDDKATLRDALRRNQLLWTIIQSALTEPNCPLPRELRQNVLRLSILVDKRTFKCLGDMEASDLDFLIDVNRNIALGLTGDGGAVDQATQAAAAAPPAAPTGKIDIKG